MANEDDFLERYLRYTAETESPHVFHRWCCLTSVGAILARKFYISHGHFRVFPNLFTMLVGDPGTRKSTAVKLSKRLAGAAGYENFAADKTRLEKFLLDLEGEVEDDGETPVAEKGKAYDKLMAQNLWGNDAAMAEPRECFIAADEWNEFAPRGDIDFCTTLGNFWDWDDENRPFTHRLKNSKSVAIFQPTISILGGNTPEGFAKAFPPEMIGTGFLSRMILIHGARSNRRYVFPPVPPQEETNAIVERLQKLLTSYKGEAQISAEAMVMLSAIYDEWEDLDDVRFKSYSNRRFTQLLKLCLIVAACAGESNISAMSVIRANTYLSAAEATMPAALGEFGKSKNSDVANKVMDVLSKATAPMKINEIWKHVHSDLEKITALGDIMQGLQMAHKIQHIKDRGFLPLKTRKAEPNYVDWSILTEEERSGL